MAAVVPGTSPPINSSPPCTFPVKKGKQALPTVSCPCLPGPRSNHCLFLSATFRPHHHLPPPPSSPTIITLNPKPCDFPPSNPTSCRTPATLAKHRRSRERYLLREPLLKQSFPKPRRLSWPLQQFAEEFRHRRPQNVPEPLPRRRRLRTRRSA